MTLCRKVVGFQEGIFSKKELITIVGGSIVVSVILFVLYMIEK